MADTAKTGFATLKSRLGTKKRSFEQEIGIFKLEFGFSLVIPLIWYATGCCISYSLADTVKTGFATLKSGFGTTKPVLGQIL